MYDIDFGYQIGYLMAQLTYAYPMFVTKVDTWVCFAFLLFLLLLPPVILLKPIGIVEVIYIGFINFVLVLALRIIGVLMLDEMKHGGETILWIIIPFIIAVSTYVALKKMGMRMGIFMLLFTLHNAVLQLRDFGSTLISSAFGNIDAESMVEIASTFKNTLTLVEVTSPLNNILAVAILVYLFFYIGLRIYYRYFPKPRKMIANRPKINR
jgi:hypothetical protein